MAAGSRQRGDKGASQLNGAPAHRIDLPADPATGFTFTRADFDLAF